MGPFGRKKKKRYYIYTKDGQDFGPMPLKELMEAARAGEVARDTEVRTVRGDWQGVAQDIPEVLKEIEAYEEEERRRREEEAIEREVKKIEKQHKRANWLPYLIGGGVLLAIGGIAATLFWPRSPTRFDPTVWFKDLSLPALKPMGRQVTFKLQPKKKVRRKRHVSLGKVVHQWSGMIQLEITDQSQEHSAGRLDLPSLKSRIWGILQRCASKEKRYRPQFRDARFSILLKKGGHATLTYVKSNSGVSTSMISCIRSGLRRIRIPVYSGTVQILSVPMRVE